MDTAQWPQEIVVKPIEEIVVVTNTCPKPIISSNNHRHSNNNNNNTIERKLTRPQKADQAVNCPRCNSTHTKFCYYNNYSLTQPRYFCKTCRRYWTDGGSLRNIPVGGGSRKNKRPSSSSSPSSSKISIITNKLPDLVHAQKNSNSNNNITMTNYHNHHHNHNQGQDLNLGFTTTTTSHHDFSNISDLVQLPNDDHHHHHHHQKSDNHNHISALELLTGLTSKGFNSSFMPMPPYGNGSSTTNTTSCTIIPPHEFKPSLSFSLDGLGNSGYGGLQESSDGGTNNGRVLFPFEDLRQVESSNNNNKEQGDHSATGYWTGMLGGGSW